MKEKINKILLFILLGFLVLGFIGFFADIIIIVLTLNLQGAGIPLFGLIIFGYFILKLKKKIYERKN